MPKRIYGNIKLDPAALRSKSELAAHIAIISSYWAEVEDTLATMYAGAMHTQPVLAATVFGRVNSLAAKLDMFEAALSFTFSLAAAAHFRKKIRDELRKCAGLRSEIVHSIWTIRDDHPDCLIRTRGLTDPEIVLWAYSENDFVEVQIRLLKLHVTLKEFGQSLVGGQDFAGPKATGWTVPMPSSDSPD